MDFRVYLNHRLPKRISDLTKYFSSYSIATASSFISKSLSSELIQRVGGNDLEVAAGSSLICTSVFFGTKWPLYRWLHEDRYSSGDSSLRDRRVQLVTTIISSVLTNVISIGSQYYMLKELEWPPASSALVAQFLGGGIGAITKIGLDSLFGLVLPSERRN